MPMRSSSRSRWNVPSPRNCCPDAARLKYRWASCSQVKPTPPWIWMFSAAAKKNASAAYALARLAAHLGVIDRHVPGSLGAGDLFRGEGEGGLVEGTGQRGAGPAVDAAQAGRCGVEDDPGQLAGLVHCGQYRPGHAGTATIHRE